MIDSVDITSRYAFLWPLIAPIRAVRNLLNANGTDLAASLAFFTVLSQLPLVALMAMLLIAIGPSDGVVEVLTEALHYLFPASRDLIDDAINSLLGGSLTIGILAVVNLMIGANRLFAATTRAVNRVFGIRNTKVVQVTIKSVSLATAVVALFMISIGLSGVIQALIRLSQASAPSYPRIVHLCNDYSWHRRRNHSCPPSSTAFIFAIIYYRIPNTRVLKRDAIFGAIVAIILFEIGKHVFFWANNHDAYQANIYGPITSVVVLMIWAYIASFIFLYGAAIAKNRQRNPAKMKFLPVTSERWPDLERFFESRGGPKHCWCMVFRPMSTALSTRRFPRQEAGSLRNRCRRHSGRHLGLRRRRTCGVVLNRAFGVLHQSPDTQLRFGRFRYGRRLVNRLLLHPQRISPSRHDNSTNQRRNRVCARQRRQGDRSLSRRLRLTQLQLHGPHRYFRASGLQRNRDGWH